MIASVNTESFWPWYLLSESQQHRWSECAGEKQTGIFAPMDRLLPFQIFVTSAPGTVASLTVYDQNDNVVVCSANDTDITVVEVDAGAGYFIHENTGALPWAVQLTCGGLYYFKIVFSGGTALTYYSELVEAISV